MHFKAKGPKLKALKWFIIVKSIFIFAEVTNDKATKRLVTLKSGKKINFLQNHCQNHILPPVRHDQHSETYSHPENSRNSFTG